LSPHSDIVALMVYEHQAEMQNRIMRASIITRQALHRQAGLNRELGEKPDHVWPSVTRQIESTCEDLVRFLLFQDEAALTSPVSGTSRFAEQFAQRGPLDSRG
jgi:hypothetical protein